MTQFVFWQNILSPHQMPFIAALSANDDVLIVSQKEMSDDRRRQGWRPPPVGKCNVVFSPSRRQVQKIVRDSASDAIHLIAGARGTRLGNIALAECVRARRCVGIISESPDLRGPGGVARLIKYSGERVLLGRHIRFVLAMGAVGTAFFLKCGYPPGAVFPFCYVVDDQADTPISESPGPLKILYVGQLIARKGVDLLVRSLPLIADATLTVVGTGSQATYLNTLASRLNVAERVNFLGSKEMHAISAIMARHHVLVLPSRWDGWGAVVNEALLAGTAVVCSDACGAADLIQDERCGIVFRSGDVQSLAHAIHRTSVLRQTGGASHRQWRIDWSANIKKDAVVAYFRSIISAALHKGIRPVAPWRHEAEPSSESVR